MIASRHMTSRRPRAFTLIDLLMVIVIIGILAAVIIPNYTVASTKAMESSVASTLHTVRTQIALYNTQNTTTLFDPLNPGGAQAWDQLLTNDYLETMPENPLQASSTSVEAAPGPGTGWVWADPTGDGVNLSAVDATGAYFDPDNDGTPD